MHGRSQNYQESPALKWLNDHAFNVYLEQEFIKPISTLFGRIKQYDNYKCVLSDCPLSSMSDHFDKSSKC